MPQCPSCGHIMTSGEECRLWKASGHCFSCYPGGTSALLDLLMGADEEEDSEEEEEDWSYGSTTKPTHRLPSAG